MLPHARNVSQVIQQDDSVGDAAHPQDEKEKIQQASESPESDATPVQDSNDNARDPPSQTEETKGQQQGRPSAIK